MLSLRCLLDMSKKVKQKVEYTSLTLNWAEGILTNIYLFVYLFMLHGLRDLHSLTRD